MVDVVLTRVSAAKSQALKEPAWPKGIFHLLQYPAVGRGSSECLDTTARDQMDHGYLIPPLSSTLSPILNHNEALRPDKVEGTRSFPTRTMYC